MDEPESSRPALVVSLVILTLICASSFSFLFDTHPYVRCTFSTAQPATCGADGTMFGDPTSQTTCTMSLGYDVATQSFVNGTFEPAVAAEGMWADCAKATTREVCEGEVKFPGFDADGAAGPACLWAPSRTGGMECTFQPENENVEECSQWVSPFRYSNVAGDVQTAADLRYLFRFIEVVSISIFTVEFMLRMSVCTQRPRRKRGFWRYFFKPLNLVDLFAIFPFYIELLLGGATTLGVLRILRMARIFRVLKLGGVVSELGLFVRGYARAREGLLLLLFLLFLYLCVFAALLYLLEYDVQTDNCYNDAGNYASLCYTDLGEKFDMERDGIVGESACDITVDGCSDGVDGKVVALDRSIEGPFAPPPFTGKLTRI